MAKDKVPPIKNTKRDSLSKFKKKKNSPQKRKQYSSEKLNLALEAINNGMSKKLASKTYCVPRSTLTFNLNNPNRQERPGPPTVLTVAEEEELVNWIKVNSRKGFPRRKEDLITSVGDYLKKVNRPNPFKDGVPGERWYQLFMKRHSELAIRTPESVTAASSCVSEDDLRRWFHDIYSYLQANNYANILEDPSRILNGDETNFQLCPKSGRVLSIKGEKNVYEVDRGQAKASLTVLFTFKANGEQTPPLIIYPNKRLPKDISSKVPPDWGIGLSENGWMKTNIFVDYIKNILHPYLTRTGTKFPVILFVDGHKTHLTLSVSELCSELQIVLVALYPNATRILQPADVGAFKPLKNGWRKSVMEWRRSNPSQSLTKMEFASILESALNNSIRPEILQNGFRAAGLFPWNPNNINFDKCLGKRVNCDIPTNTDVILKRNQFLDIIKECQYEKDVILKEIFDYFHVDSPTFTRVINGPEDQIDEYDIANFPVIIHDSVEDWTNSQEVSCYEVSHEVDIHFPPAISNTALHLTPDKSNTPLVLHHKELLDNTDFSQESNLLQSHILPKKLSTKINENKAGSLKKINLKDTLVLAKTPVRKKGRNIERVSFVLTSEEWQKNEKSKADEKQKKIEEVKKRKEERIIKKQLKESKDLLNKTRNETKKIVVLSNVTVKPNSSTSKFKVSDTQKENAKPKKTALMNTNMEEYTLDKKYLSEQVMKVKTKLEFDEGDRLNSTPNKLLKTPIRSKCNNKRLNADNKNIINEVCDQGDLLLAQKSTKQNNKTKFRLTLQDEDIINLLEENSQ